MATKHMFIIVVTMLLTSMLPFFRPFHEPVQLIYRYFVSL